MSSKGHLAWNNKLKVRSRNDADAAATLHSFDVWYAKYDIDGLLAERMVAKDEKEAKEKLARGKCGPKSKVNSSRNRVLLVSR